jgi:DNA replicative helicase MCM subunit Mcm2 (Cdc46/Mcm family)
LSEPTIEEVVETRVSKLDANLVGRRVRLNGQIVSEQSQKALPAKLIIACSRCSSQVEVDLAKEGNEGLLEAVIFKQHDALKRRAEAFLIDSAGPQCLKKPFHSVRVEEEGNIDYAILAMRDLLEETEKFDQQVFQSRRVYLVGVKVPPSKKQNVEGVVTVDPSTRDICVLADRITPLETQVAGFTVTDEDRVEWPKWFNSDMDITAQIAPDMVGREIVQQAYLLVLHSVPEIPDVYGRIIRGCLRALCFGDTKTYKSDSAKDLTINHYGLGGFIVAESASRTGITYTIDNENKAIIWGELPNNDLGLVVIDGLHTMFAEELKELREALENQRVVVRRSVSGEALSRTRVIGIFNPAKPMSQYLYSCMAVKDNPAFYDPPDITRWDLFLPFSDDDVLKEKIATRRPRIRPIPDKVFKRHIYWAWSRKPEHVQYTEDARKLIVEKSTEYMQKLTLSSLPIVHNGIRDVLCRLSVAAATLDHSTDDTNTLIIVDRQHVEKVIDFYEDMLDKLGLKEYKLEEEGRLEIQPSEIEEIRKDLGETELAILNSIRIHSKSSAVLAEELDLSDVTIKRHYKPLRKHGLISTQTKTGVTLTARGVQFLRALTSGISVSVSKNDTNKPQLKLMGQIVSKNDTNKPQLKLMGQIVSKNDTNKPQLKLMGQIVSKNDTNTLIPSVGEKLKIVYGKCRELAVDGLVSKFTVADALDGEIPRNEVFQLLEVLEREGKLVAKGPEWYLVV